MSPLRVLVCALLPEFDRDRGSHRIFDLISSLQAAGAAVTFVSHHAHHSARHARILQQRGIAVYSGASDWMEALITTQHYDLMLFGLWHIAEPYIPLIRRLSPATRIIVDSIDLHFLRLARQAFQGTADNEPSGVLDQHYASEMIREINTYAAADAVLAVSRKEADLISDLAGNPTLASVVPDMEEEVPSAPSFAERAGILFVGCFRHTPNIGAVKYLCKDILPRVDPALLAEHPIYIVGDGLDETVCQYGAGLPYVRMVGWVPSLQPYYEHARIAVIPLLYGAGTKGKLIQALMTGTPTVSTRIGIEGLGLQDGQHVLVADDPATFADSITRLLGDSGMWQRLSRQGRTHITAEHGQDAVRARLMEVIEAVLTARNESQPTLLDQPDPQSNGQPMSRAQYRDLVGRVREAVGATLPPEATVMVVSKGDGELLRLDGRQAWHFPQSADGSFAGFYPADDGEAIAHLETLRAKGGKYLVFPKTSYWWLDYYAGLKRHLEERCQLVTHQEDTCLIYALPEHRNGTILRMGEGRGRGENKPDSGETRLVAFYLPQFHPIPENDVWWGKGFTEWTNVARAQPLYPGHEQPRLPAELGFYDLRLPDVLEAQSDLAMEHEIYGFCFYHYWFDGKLLLEGPFDHVLRSNRPDFRFCLCWANEPWSRRWDGRPHEVLQPQSYSDEDDIAHIRWLMPALADSRAIQIGGRPVFLVYQGRDLPNPARTTETWREQVQTAGLGEIYLLAVETGWDSGWDATQAGFDAKVLFQPQFTMLRNSGARIPMNGKHDLQIYDYQKAWPVLADPEPVDYRRYDTVFPGWDNSPRVGDRAVVLCNSTPEAYEQWLKRAVAKAQKLPADQRVVFINAWNEWGEGCYLEPDVSHGRAYLEATSRAMLSAAPRPQRQTRAAARH